MPKPAYATPDNDVDLQRIQREWYDALSAAERAQFDGYAAELTKVVYRLSMTGARELLFRMGLYFCEGKK
jgi:hypothetical protein